VAVVISRHSKSFSLLRYLKVKGLDIYTPPLTGKDLIFMQ